MEENLEQNKDVDNEMSVIDNKSNTEEIKLPKSEKINDQDRDINKNENVTNSKNNVISKVFNFHLFHF